MQDDAIWVARVHLPFIAVTGLKCSYGKIFSQLTKIQGAKKVSFYSLPFRQAVASMY